MGMPAETRRRWSATEVRALTAEQPGWWPRYELIDGDLLVTPAPSMKHARAIGWLHTVLNSYVLPERLGELFLSPSDIGIQTGTIVQPDLFVIPRDIAESAKQWPDVTQLMLIVEVTSPSTARYDRGPKRLLYQAAGVNEYWIVDLEARLVERWNPGDDRPEVIRDVVVWRPHRAKEALSLHLADLFAAARLD
jgi:Uma2 family endonuclease